MATMSERLLPMPEMTTTDIYRFWAYVDKKSDSKCWNWFGSFYDNRYGRFSHRRNTYCAHRISYYIHYKDPGHLLVCHECNNGLCVNPHHLFLGTHLDNMQHASDCNRRNQNGILNPTAKLTENDIRQIRKLYGQFGYIKLGKMFQVSSSNIREIIKGRTWRHVV